MEKRQNVGTKSAFTPTILYHENLLNAHIPNLCLTLHNNSLIAVDHDAESSMDQSLIIKECWRRCSYKTLGAQSQPTQSFLYVVFSLLL